MNRLFLVFISLIIIVPMSLISNYHFFLKYSKIGSILSIISLAALLYYSFEKIGKSIIKNEGDIANFSKFPAFLGVSIFAFESVGSILAIRNSMKKPQDFDKIFYKITLSISFIYIIFAVICCLALGSTINQIILLGYNYFIKNKISQNFIFLKTHKIII